MKKNKTEVREFSAEEQAVRIKKRKNIIAFAVCILIAFLLWLVIMNVDTSSVLPDSGDTALPSILMSIPRIGS